MLFLSSGRTISSTTYFRPWLSVYARETNMVTTPVEHRPSWLEPMHVPDRIFLSLSVLAWMATLVFTIWAWPQLPSTVPQHIDIHGQVDSRTAKTIFSVFGVSMVNILLGLGIAFSYLHPEYTNLPTDRRWRSFPEPLRSQVTMGVRHLLAMTCTWATLLLCCVQLDLISLGLGSADPRLTIVLFGIVGLMLFSIGAYTILLTRWVDRSAA